MSCVLLTGKCNSDSDCAEGYVCDSNSCEEVVVEEPVPEPETTNLSEECAPLLDSFAQKYKEQMDANAPEPAPEETSLLPEGDLLLMLLGAIALLGLGGIAGWHGNNHLSGEEGEEEYEE